MAFVITVIYRFDSNSATITVVTVSKVHFTSLGINV